MFEFYVLPLPFYRILAPQLNNEQPMNNSKDNNKDNNKDKDRNGEKDLVNKCLDKIMPRMTLRERR